jgi:fatty acid elongase 3
MLDLDAFDWSVAPLARFEVVIATAIIYALAAVTARLYLHRTTAPKASGASYVLAAHSLVLCAASFIMCAGAVRAVLQRVKEEGWAWFYCEDPTTNNPQLYAWAYAYYLSKYYESLDTFLPMLIKGRAPNHFGLHVFHHACVLLMAWGYVEYKQTLCFGGLVTNTFVHVVMYYYYFRAALKWETPWKAWVTRLQILQFTISFIVLGVTLSGTYGALGTCAGLEALGANAAFNTVLLLLFVGILRGPPRKTKVK